jgi:hypothetical protein
VNLVSKEATDLQADYSYASPETIDAQYFEEGKVQKLRKHYYHDKNMNNMLPEAPFGLKLFEVNEDLVVLIVNEP